jgi:hypothetical protein
MHKSEVLFLTNSERMIIPEGLQERTIRFYHENLKHPGVTRTMQTIQQFMVRPKMQASIEKYVNQSSICQKFKRSTKKYGKLPTKILVTTAWVEVHLDPIGPIHNQKIKMLLNFMHYPLLTQQPLGLSYIHRLISLQKLLVKCLITNGYVVIQGLINASMIRGVPSLLMNSKSSFPPIELFQAQQQFRIPKPTQFLSVSIR